MLVWSSLTAGPATYTLPIPVHPSPYCGEQLSVDWDPHYPAPNEYQIPGVVGRGPAKSFGIKHERMNGEPECFLCVNTVDKWSCLFYSPLLLLAEADSPGPSRYYPCPINSPVAHSITYRAFSTPSM